RVPCSNGMRRDLRTGNATVRLRLQQGVRRVPGRVLTGLPLSGYDHRLAILVNQGSDPMGPYQALVIPEGAALIAGFAPWQVQGVLGSGGRSGGVYSPDSADGTAPTPRRASTSGRMSPRS